MRSLGAIVINDSVERFDPFLGFGGVEVLLEDVVELMHGELLSAAPGGWRGCKWTSPQGETGNPPSLAPTGFFANWIETIRGRMGVGDGFDFGRGGQDFAFVCLSGAGPASLG